MSRDDGGPAFPVAEHLGPDNKLVPEHPGMSLRDYFAAKAMQGMLACPVRPQSDEHMYARDAYTLADAMLKARAK